jgi:HK97 family phage prohead protease
VLYKNVSNSSISGVIKDVDTKTGTVTGYFSIFGNVDSDGDMIMPGAFKRTLQNNYARHKHLNQHRSGEVLSGTKKGNLVLKEDNKGLYFESKISQTTLGKDVILLYEDGALDEHSIGYEVLKSRDSDNLTRDAFAWSEMTGNPTTKKVPVKELIELKLWEGSTVTWGANERATTESIKSLTKEQAFDKMQTVLKALRNGKYEHEEIFEMLELTFKQLEQHIVDLSASSTQPAVITAPDPQKGVKSDDLSEDEATLIYLKLKSITSKQQVNSYEAQLQRMALS